MRIHQTSDRALFMANRPPGKRVRVVRMPCVEYVRHNGRLTKVSAIGLTYSYWCDDQQWVLEEMRFANVNDTRVDLADTLWAELDQQGDCVLIKRSGSF
jgi:hypothetical protein